MGNRKRNFFLDNAKFFLILLVVFGHLLQPITKYNRWIYELYLLIYSFHMPAFIYISGYFSKSFLEKDQPIKDSFYKLIIPYIVFQWGYSLYYWLIGIEDSLSVGLLIPNWSLWFLVSLFFWRISLFLFSGIKPRIGIGLSVLGSLFIGYIPFVGRELTLQRTFVFLPFFVMGYYTREDSIYLFEKSQWRRLLAVILPIMFLIIHHIPGLNKYVFFGSRPYEDFLDIVELGALVRLFGLILGTIGTIGFLSLIPTNKQIFTQWGQNTLVIYLYHGFFVRGLRSMELPIYNLFNYSYSLTLFILLVGSFIMTMVLASEPIVKSYQKLIERLIKRLNKLFGIDSAC